MTTIDQLDISVHNLYAMRTVMLEKIQQEFRFHEADSIPPQTLVMDLYPRSSELDILFGVRTVGVAFAYFYEPKKLRFLRRSPFSYRVTPSIGDYSDQDKALEKLESVATRSPEEEKEKGVLRALFGQLEQINDWLGFITGRRGQFLQG